MTTDKKQGGRAKRRPSQNSAHKVCSSKRAEIKSRLLNYEVRLRTQEIVIDNLISELRNLLGIETTPGSLPVGSLTRIIDFEPEAEEEAS